MTEPYNPYGTPQQQPPAYPTYEPLQPPSDPYAQPAGNPYAQPYGQPASPYAQPTSPYGQPVPNPYGQQPASQYGQPGFNPYGPQQPTKTNGLAIAAFVISLLCGISVIGVIFAIVALRQIKQRNEKGRGLAIASLVITGLWVLVLVGGGILASTLDTTTASDRTTTTTTSSTRPTPSATGPVGINPLALKTGQCLKSKELTEGSILTVTPLPCTQPHDAEVFALFNTTTSVWAASTLENDADSGCRSRVSDYIPSKATQKTLSLFYIYPDKVSFGHGNRNIICIAISDAELTKSVKG